MLTGCKDTYTIRKANGGGYGCFGAFNPNDERWETLANSPHDGFRGMWPMTWPKVGGGGELGSTLSEVCSAQASSSTPPPV